jgi:hypothetical protein
MTGVKMSKLPRNPQIEALNKSSFSDERLIEKLSSIKLTSFMKKHGSQWRWAVLVHLASLLKKLDIQEVDLHDLSFITSFQEDTQEEKEVEYFFQALYNLMSKLCLVEISVTPFPVPKKKVDEKESYMISIN